MNLGKQIKSLILVKNLLENCRRRVTSALAGQEKGEEILACAAKARKVYCRRVGAAWNNIEAQSFSVVLQVDLNYASGGGAWCMALMATGLLHCNKFHC